MLEAATKIFPENLVVFKTKPDCELPVPAGMPEKNEELARKVIKEGEGREERIGETGGGSTSTKSSELV